MAGHALRALDVPLSYSFAEAERVRSANITNLYAAADCHCQTNLLKCCTRPGGTATFVAALKAMIRLIYSLGLQLHDIVNKKN